MSERGILFSAPTIHRRTESARKDGKRGGRK